MIGRPSKQSRIREAIRRQVRSGELQAGDRLASIKELCAHFRAGQATVRGALRELAAERVLEIRDRSGCYVRGAAERPSAGPEAAGGEGGAAPAHHDLREFFLPAPRPRERLRLYVSEMYAPSLALWREVLAAFPDAEVDLVSCGAGHAADLFAREELDLVQATPAVLQQIGAEEFLPWAALQEALPVGAADFVPPVRERLERGGPLPGAPFSLTTHYLFVNQALAGQTGAEETPADCHALLRSARAAEEALADAPAHALALTNTLDWILMSGALRWAPERGLLVDEPAAAAVFAQLQAADFPALGGLEVAGRFGAGELVYLIHCSFTTIPYRDGLPFPWRLAPLPLAPGLRMPGYCTALAVRRASPRRELCLALAKHLLSPAVQERFGRLHGNLPVLSTAVEALPGIPNVLSPATIRESLARTTLLWPEALHTGAHRRLNFPPKPAAGAGSAEHAGELLQRFRDGVAALSGAHATAATG